MRQPDVLTPGVMFNVPKAIARIEMFSGWTGWRRRFGGSTDSRRSSMRRSSSSLGGTAVRPGLRDHERGGGGRRLPARPSSQRESSRPSKTSTLDPRRHGRRVRHAELGWQGSVRTAAAVRMLAGREMEVAPWMADEMRLSVHYRRARGSSRDPARRDQQDRAGGELRRPQDQLRRLVPHPGPRRGARDHPRQRRLRRSRASSRPSSALSDRRIARARARPRSERAPSMLAPRGPEPGRWLASSSEPLSSWGVASPWRGPLLLTGGRSPRSHRSD